MNDTYIGINVRRMKPTQKHRRAIWEGILGTVYAQNPQGEIKYFDYKWDEAKTFAGIENGRDYRTWKYETSHFRYPGSPDYPRKNQLVLFIIDGKES